MPSMKRHGALSLIAIGATLVCGHSAVATPTAEAATSGARLPDSLTAAVNRDRKPAGPSPRAPDGKGTSSAPREIPLLSPKPARLRRAKARAADGVSGGAGGPVPRALSPSPKAAEFGERNKPGMAATDSTPPDTTGAIGPSHYVEFVNGTGIAAYDRSLNSVSGPVRLEDFIGFPGDNVFDPQIQWDDNWGRWIYVMDDIEEVEIGPEEFEKEHFLAVGWSKSANPSNLSTEEPGEEAGAGWCGYFIPTEDEFDDYPKLGHSDAGITIGTNVFNSAGNFVTSRIWSIAKPENPEKCPKPGVAASFGSAAEPLLTEDEDVAFTPMPANTADSSPDSYVVAADSPLFPEPDAEIMAWHITGAGAGAALLEDGNIEVAPFEVPASVPQPLPSLETLDTLDTRLTNAVAVTDPEVGEEAVWTQHTVNGPGGRSVVRWYELLPGAPTPTVQQEGEITDSEHFIFNGAISPTKRGDAAAINFNRASAALLPEMHAQSRDSGTPPDEMEGDVLLGSSAGAAQDSSCDFAEEEPCRWGDYAGASPDPSLAAVVWGSNQGLAAPLLPPDHEDARWTTRNFALVADSTIADLTPPPAPTIAETNPASPANDNSPMLIGSAEAGSTISVHLSADCSAQVVATGSAADFGTEGIAVPVPEDQTTQLSATATDEVDNTSLCSGAFSYTESTPPPVQPAAAPPHQATVPPPPQILPIPGIANVGKVALVRGGKALLRMRCHGPGACRGVARLVVRVKVDRRSRHERAGRSGKRVRNLLIGKATRFSIPAGRVRVVRVPLTRRGKALVSRRTGRRGLPVKLRGRGVRHRSVTLKQRGKGKRDA